MSNSQQKADFIVGVVKNAILDGWTKEQFLSISESAWDFLSTPGPGQWGPMQDQPTLETSPAPKRLAARSAEERAAGPDKHVRCGSCDQGFFEGEVFTYARECCEEGKQFDIRAGVPALNTSAATPYEDCTCIWDLNRKYILKIDPSCRYMGVSHHAENTVAERSWPMCRKCEQRHIVGSECGSQF